MELKARVSDSRSESENFKWLFPVRLCLCHGIQEFCKGGCKEAGGRKFGADCLVHRGWQQECSLSQDVCFLPCVQASTRCSTPGLPSSSSATSGVMAATLPARQAIQGLGLARVSGGGLVNEPAAAQYANEHLSSPPSPSSTQQLYPPGIEEQGVGGLPPLGPQGGGYASGGTPSGLQQQVCG